MTENGRTVQIEVLRYRPEQEDEPAWQRFTVPFSDDMSVLQGLLQIKDDQDGSLSLRWSCRMAICGSCGMMVNGKPRLACQIFLRDLLPGPVRVQALAHFPIERDLVVSVDGFVDKLQAVQPWLIPKAPRRIDEGEHLQTPEQLAEFEQFSSCINCMLCYSACPQFGLNPDFTGPGVLALLHRYNADSRDGGAAQRMAVLNAEEGVWSCTAVGYCSEVCPKGVDPANAVNQNKLNSAKDYFLRFLRPHRGAHEPPRRPRPRRAGAQDLRAADGRLVEARPVLHALHAARGHRAGGGGICHRADGGAGAAGAGRGRLGRLACRTALAGLAAVARGAARGDGRACTQLVRDYAQDDADHPHRRPAPGRRHDHPHRLAGRFGGHADPAGSRLGVALMKRSNAPIFWLLFGAGGMLSALLGTGLVFITGIAVPLGWPLRADLMDYPQMLALARNGLGKALLFAVVSLFAWHAAHRIFHSLHDLGLRHGPLARLACYGGALAVTLVGAVALLGIGF